jgi:hypothetical protein
MFWKKRIGTYNLGNSFRGVGSAPGGTTEQKTSQDQILKIPDLEIYIVNLLDPKENHADTVDIVPQDLDGVRERHIDIKLSDGFDAKTEGLLTDYVNLIDRLVSLGENNKSIKDNIDEILEETAPRRYNTEEYKKYVDILKVPSE